MALAAAVEGGGGGDGVKLVIGLVCLVSLSLSLLCEHCRRRLIRYETRLLCLGLGLGLARSPPILHLPFPLRFYFFFGVTDCIFLLTLRAELRAS